jgi:hypothetical protein
MVRRGRRLDAALEAIETLADAKVAVVPAEPTPEMIAAGAAAAGITPRQARLAYLAMLKAG